MPSFDIVSEIDKQEVHNAVENASRELASRFDFKGANASFEWKNNEAVIKAEGDFQLEQMLTILRGKLLKRGIDPEMMDLPTPDHTNAQFTQAVKFKEGIDSAIAKKIVKAIKDSKAKVQTAIQGEQLRVTGKKRDDLQAVMQLVKEGDFGQPFQFNNFRD